MSNKREKKKNATKKTSNTRKTLMLKLDNGAEIPAETAYMKDNTKCFKINDVDIKKIRVSEKKLYSKEHNSYKYYVFHEHDDDYIPLRIILKDVVGKYNVYRDRDNSNSAKGMSFKIDDDLLFKSYHIFEHFAEEKDIAFDGVIYESKGEEYLKTKVNDETCFREDGKFIVNPKENTKYTCRVLLQIQSIFFQYER